MHIRHARCSCGGLAVHTEGEPVRVSVCHCLACQTRSGSAFAAQARFPAAHVTVEGAGREYVRVNDEGRVARFTFCPVCGVTVLYRLEAEPGQVAIPLGVFADPAFPPPTTSVYGMRQHGWVRLADEIAQYD
ncbi:MULTISPECIES: GFA family protein [Luteimonas]|uniref:GFA family protein n=1 Tax=Luteimonas TaxID=83614 RepID=UPI000C7D4AA7|nr:MULTISPECIES: GFA family protein [Luteimonas]